MARAPEENPVDTDAIRDISVAVYKQTLGADTPRLLAEPGGSEKLRRNAGAYDKITRCYLNALGIPLPRKGEGLFE